MKFVAEVTMTGRYEFEADDYEEANEMFEECVCGEFQCEDVVLDDLYEDEEE